MDAWAIMFIVAPIFFPIIKAVGFDPIWFAILFVINEQMGYISPPFGYNLFYLRAVAPPDISMADIYRSIWPFLGLMIVGMILVMLFPEMALSLPNIMISPAVKCQVPRNCTLTRE